MDNKNMEVIEGLEIIDIDIRGQGVGKKDGFTYFIEGTILGEVVDGKILDRKKNFANGIKIRTVKPSQHEINPICHHYYNCDGCNLMDTNYATQMAIKKKTILDQLNRFAGESITDMEIISMENPFGYRNKIILRVGDDFSIGYYNKGSHKLVEIDSCPIALKCIYDFLPTIKGILKENLGKNTNISSLQIRGNKKGDIQLTLVVKKSIASNTRLVEALMEVDNLVQVYESINVKNTNMGREAALIFEKEKFTDTIGDLIFQIAPKSFFQVNSITTKKLYQEALDQLSLKGDERILDLYCGIGTTTIFLGQKAKKVVGVEIVPDAIEDAKINAKYNCLENVEFVLGKSEDKIEKLIKQNFDIIMVDPPRKGLDEKTVVTLGKSSIRKICYISCNPQSLARDIKALKQYGFTIKKIKGCDMFAQNIHVETVVLLERD